MELSYHPPAASPKVPRVAFFTDSFHEVNGVALTSRQFAAHARSSFYPFLSVHAGPSNGHCKRGSFETLELATSAMQIPLERDLKFDLRFHRHRDYARNIVKAFRPDLIHVTGPGHIGLLGALIAYDLGVPLFASWHTNVHEFGSSRLEKLLRNVPMPYKPALVQRSEAASLAIALRFYQLASCTFAPNPELSIMLATRTAKPCFIMQRGIDANLYHPERRKRAHHDFVIGYVGRLSPEKNVRVLSRLDTELRTLGVTNHRFLIVGDGSERAWLQQQIPSAEFPGVLTGDRLADAYASMDAFVFPSETDTYGNVVLEAMASGVVPIVTRKGGPKFLVKHGSTGLVVHNPADLTHAVHLLYHDATLRTRMAKAARAAAMRRSWSEVFESVYSHYSDTLSAQRLTAA